MDSLARPATPKGSRPGTPSGRRTPNRPGTPSRVVENMADAWLKNPPNNLNLADPSEQSRTNDLIGARDTQPISDPPTAEEMARVEEMARKLNK